MSWAVDEALEWRDKMQAASESVSEAFTALSDGDVADLGDNIKAMREAVDEVHNAVPCYSGTVEFIESLEAEARAEAVDPEAENWERRGVLLARLADELDEVAPTYARTLRDILRAPDKSPASPMGSDPFAFAKVSVESLATVGSVA